MKTRNLLLSLCCMAALTACTGNDEPAAVEERAGLTQITLSIEDAQTRTYYTNEDGKLKGVWNTEEAVSVIYVKDGVTYNEKFTITVDAGNATGVFEYSGEGTKLTGKDGELESFISATSGIKAGDKIAIYYPYADMTYAGTHTKNIPDATLMNENEGTSVNLSSLDIMYTGQVTVGEDGTLPTLKMNKAMALLCLPAGLQLFTEDVSEGTAKFTLTGVKGHYIIYYNADGTPTAFDATTASKWYKGQSIRRSSFSGKTLTENIYFAFLPSGTETPTIKVEVGDKEYTWEFTKAKAFEAGKVYQVTQETFGDPKKPE